MKKITISILILAILMVCSSISFGQEGMKPETKKGNTIQISISPDELNRTMWIKGSSLPLTLSSNFGKQ